MNSHVLAFVALSSTIGWNVAHAAEEARADSDEATTDEPESTAIPITSAPPLRAGHPESDPTTDLPPLIPLHPIGTVRVPAPPDTVPVPAFVGDSTVAEAVPEVAAPAPQAVAVVVEEQRSPWLRTPRLIAYGSGALGLAAIGAGIVSGLDARAAESSYRRASTQVGAADAKRRSERSGKRANTWLAVGGAVTAAAVSTVVLDVLGVLGGSEQA
ncbi:MAG: hypothetical protein Q7S02_05810, partial [bacterium]|nr:hypothetical protein [bacterium]